MPATADAAFVGPVQTPLDALAREIEHDAAAGKISQAELERYGQVVAPHVEKANETVQEVLDFVKAEPEHLKDVLHDPIADLLAARHDNPDAPVEPREVAGVMGPVAHEILNVEEHIYSSRIDYEEERVGAWREIVEVRAERGDESPATIQAQRDQLDKAQEAIDHARTDLHDGAQWAHGQTDARVDYVLEHNDTSALEPHEAPDVQHYNLPASEHVVPEEA